MHKVPAVRSNRGISLVKTQFVYTVWRLLAWYS